jgi:hypothetical protein
MKHDALTISTEAGIQIDRSVRQDEKTRPSISRSFDGEANLTIERDSQDSKQDAQRISTEAGIQTDLRYRQDEKAFSSIR